MIKNFFKKEAEETKKKFKKTRSLWERSQANPVLWPSNLLRAQGTKQVEKDRLPSRPANVMDRQRIGCIPFLSTYLQVTSLASARVLLAGTLKRNVNKRQKNTCTTSEDMKQHGDFKEYLMLHIFIFI